MTRRCSTGVIDESFHFTRIAAWLACAIVCSAAAAAGQSKLVSVGKDGKLQYAADAAGNTIPDFSNCGYMGGGVAFPPAVKATLRPEKDSKDDTRRIQDAIDAVAKMPADMRGLRGAVLLTKGTYRVAGQLKITTGGVVLRGEGDGEDGTILIAAGQAEAGGDRRTRARPARAGREVRDGGHGSFVPVGCSVQRRETRRASRSVIGDRETRRQRRVDHAHRDGPDHGPAGAPENTTKQWTPFDLNFDRVVTAIDGNKVTVDAPIACAIDPQWGGGASAPRQRRRAGSSRSASSDLRGVSEYRPIGQEEGERQGVPRRRRPRRLPGGLRQREERLDPRLHRRPHVPGRRAPRGRRRSG